MSDILTLYLIIGLFTLAVSITHDTLKTGFSYFNPFLKRDVLFVLVEVFIWFIALPQLIGRMMKNEREEKTNAVVSIVFVVIGLLFLKIQLDNVINESPCQKVQYEYDVKMFEVEELKDVYYLETIDW